MTRDNETKATPVQVKRHDSASAARTLERLERLVGAFAEELGRLEESLQALSGELTRLRGERDGKTQSLH